MEASEPSTSSTNNSTINNTSGGQITDTTVAEASAAGLSVDEFLSTGRTGRRNALPDILEEKSSHLNTAELPNELEKLSFSEGTSSGTSLGASQTKANPNPPRTTPST